MPNNLFDQITLGLTFYVNSTSQAWQQIIRWVPPLKNFLKFAMFVHDTELMYLDFHQEASPTNPVYLNLLI